MANEWVQLSPTGCTSYRHTGDDTWPHELSLRHLTDPELLALATVTEVYRRVDEVKALVRASREMLEQHGYYCASAVSPEPIECDCAGCKGLRATLAPFKEAK